MTEVTNSDLRWRKSFYEVTGYFDKDMSLAKTIARHREAISSKHQATIEAQAAEIERLREVLVAEREENLWNAYATGDVRGDEWTHLFMSDGEWLAKECGFDPRQGYYSAEAIRNAIPIAARAALGETEWRS